VTVAGIRQPVGLTARRRLTIAALAAIGWAVSRAGVSEIVNGGGWPSFARFWAAAARPELAREFVALAAEATVVTLGFAVLGTVLAVILGAAGAPAMSKLIGSTGRVRRVSLAVGAVLRSVHEIIWALLLVQVLGFDPLVAVLALGIPFGAVAAKVFADTIDEADPGPYRALVASGSPRLSALLYGVVPSIRGELISYSFYRFECAIRSAAVLGVIGAGGLGFQLDLSFESLRYHEIWTLIVALMILSGLADWWSTSVRRATSPVVGRVSVLAVVALVPLSAWWVGLDPRGLWSERTRRLAADLVGRLVPVRLGPGGWSELVGATVDTLAMSVLALVIAVAGGLVVGVMASRGDGPSGSDWPVGLGLRLGARLVLLLLRAVPAPVWAFLMVLVLFPGLWPGAVALGLYNLGVLGRLFAEAIDERDQGPTRALARTGASAVQALAYGTLPTASPRLVSLALYRWEVIVRETVVVGVVGAGGLGQLINDHLAARDFAAVSGAVLALVGVAVAIDRVSGWVRHILRSPSPSLDM
jgi:phosphonate transport system permease protein